MMTLSQNSKTCSRNLEISKPVQSPPLCPICGEVVGADTKTRPFCSSRCKLIDLGSWLDGSYLIPLTEDEPGIG